MLIDTSNGKQIRITVTETERHTLVQDDKALEKYLAVLATLRAFTGITDVWVMEEE